MMSTNAKQKFTALSQILGWSIVPLIFIFVATAGLAWTPGDLKTFEKANQDYRQGRFQKALEGYQSLAQKFPADGGLFYNLGNTHYRLENLGEAILAYERAKWLEPRDVDTRYNLKYLLDSLEYRMEDKRNWSIQIGEKFLSYFSEKEIRCTALLIFFLLLSSWAVSLFFRGAPLWGWPRKLLLVLFFIFAALGGAKNIQSHFIRSAIVMLKEAPVRYGPSEGDQVAIRLREGLKVYVVERREDWSRVLLVNGESGWMDNRQIAEIRLK